MLGPAFFWIDTPEGSYLQENAACVAAVTLRDQPARVWIKWAGREVRGVAPSRRKGKEHVERWLAPRLEGRVRRRNYRMPPHLLEEWRAANAFLRSCAKK